MLAIVGMMVLRLFLSPCGPLRELQPVPLLKMRESITIMHFPGHYQRWGEPRTRMNAGALCRNKRSDTVGELKSAEICVSHMPSLKAKKLGTLAQEKVLLEP